MPHRRYVRYAEESFSPPVLTSIGSTKAAVFPLPVFATPSTSLPLRAAGSACAWMAVGRSYLKNNC